jgi:putative addiction module CopG family antidote
MSIDLSPEIRSYIDEQVRQGRYASPDALLEAAVQRLREADDEVLSSEDCDLLERRDERMQAGEFLTVAQVRDRLRQRDVIP